MGLSQRTPKILSASTHRHTIAFRSSDCLRPDICAGTLYLHVVLRNLTMDIVMLFEANLTANKFAYALPPCLKAGASTARGVW
jgi:hypothetical protein